MSCLCEINDATLDSSTDGDPHFFSSSRSSLLWTDYCSKGKKCAKNKQNCKDSFPPRGNNKKRTDKDFFSGLTVVVVFFNWIVKISEKTLYLAEMTKWYCFMYTWKMRDNLERVSNLESNPYYLQVSVPTLAIKLGWGHTYLNFFLLTSAIFF